MGKIIKFNKSKEIILGIITACIGTLLTIFLLEIILRIFPTGEITMNNPYRYTKTKGQLKYGVPFNTYSEIYPLQFDARGYYKKSNGVIDYHFNQVAARWLQAEEQKISDRNIIVIGDSFTYGFGLRYEDTYIYKVQSSLNKGGANLSFINFSTPAFNSIACLKTYKKMQDKIPHNYVMYGLHVNDLIEFHTSYVISNVHRFRMRIRAWSKAADFILDKVERIKSRHENIKKLLDPSNFERPCFVDNMNVINEINIETKKRDVKFLVVILPILVNVREETFKPIYDKIKAQFANNKIDYFDLSDSVCCYKDSDLWILPFDQHPNEIANRIFAEQLGKFLIYEIKD